MPTLLMGLFRIKGTTRRLWAEDEDMPDGTYARSGDASFTPEAVVS